jgi:hypothetical protein
MNEDAGSPLDRDIAALLREEGNPPAPAEAFARVRSRLAGVVPALRDDGDGGAPSRLGRAFGAHPMTTGLALLSLGAALGASAHAAFVHPAVQIRTVYVQPPPASSDVPSIGPVLPAVSPVASASPPVTPVSSASPFVRPSSAPSVASPTPPSAEASPETLATERALLDEARSAIAHGDAARATDLLDRHARTFPRAALVEEREALTVEALAVAGQSDEARAALAHFRARYPRSLFLSALEGIADPARMSPKGRPVGSP